MAIVANRKLLTDVALFAVSQIAFYYVFKYMVSALDPQKEKKDTAKNKSKGVLTKLGMGDLELTEHEAVIAQEIILPVDITTTFDDVGGLDSIIDSLRESIIFPLVYPEVFQSVAGLYGPPKGVLLYGPPGCGKTMLAKALAKESGATFINMKASVLQDKWYGESNKLVSALFSLARKLQPSIIFIDEIDSFMRERTRTDHEVSGMVKAEFMSSWDGLTTSEDTRIMVLGATNRALDIDQAILRRMPKRFPVKLPSVTQRKSILSLMLRDVALESNFDLDLLARRTEGLSGSDLKELCRNAASMPVREHFKLLTKQASLELPSRKDIRLRPLSIADFFSAPQEGNKFTSIEEDLD